MKYVVLFIVALFLFAIISPFAFVFALVVPSKTGRWKTIQKYLFRIAISIDQAGNVVCATFFNWILIDSDGHKFGDEDETISSVLGKNKKLGTLSKWGMFLDAILSLFDENHSIKSIEQE